MNDEKDVARLLKPRKRSVVHKVFGSTAILTLLVLLQAFYLLMMFWRLHQYSPYFFGGGVLISAVMLVFVLNSRENPAAKLSWCIVIALAPIFGTCLYIYSNIEIGRRAEQKILQKVEKESQVYLPKQDALMTRLQREEPELYSFARYTSNHYFSVYENTKVTYFPQGEDKLEEVLRQLKKAEKFIFLEYFIVEEGEMWGRILHILLEKAKAGVEVRLLYDGTCAFNTLPNNYPKKLQAHGIQCKLFAPVMPFMSTHYNFRDHRKILVIDGHTGFTGGINLADEYINRKEKHGHWKDTAVMLQGDAVYGLTHLFLQMWNATEKKRVYEPYLIQPVADKLSRENETPGYVIPYGDSPLDNEKMGEMVYLDMINTARDYVYIMSPYLILDNEMVTALTFAAKRGVDVKLILPHIPDKKYVYVLAKSHYRELTEAGVKIYEYTPGFVHAKVFLSDHKKAVVGTINLDYRSLYLHFECAAYLYKVPAIDNIFKDFQNTLAKCQQITPEMAKKIGIGTRLAGAVLKVISPLM